jgi:hypothetical protein
MSKQLSRFQGDCETESLLDPPLAIELIYDQVGISIDRHPSWRARAEIFQDVQDTSIFRHVVGHGPGLADDPVLLHEDGTSFVLDYHSAAGSSSAIDRSTSSIEPGSVFIHTAFSPGRRKGRGSEKEVEGGGNGGGILCSEADQAHFPIEGTNLAGMGVSIMTLRSLGARFAVMSPGFQSWRALRIESY